MDRVGYVRHIVSTNNIYVDLKKVRVVLNWEHLTTMIEVWNFLTLAGYHHCLVEGFSKIARALHYLTQKRVKFEWMDKYEWSFQELKKKD